MARRDSRATEGAWVARPDDLLRSLDDALARLTRIMWACGCGAAPGGAVGGDPGGSDRLP